MFERLKKWKHQEVQVKPDVIPKHIMPNREHIIALGYSESKQYFAGFLKGLTRTQLMDYQDSKQFDDTAVEEASWECANDEEWTREYPIGQHGYEERIPSIVRDTMGTFDVKKLKEHVEGMQKKLDRLSKLIENTEVTMSGKTALKL